jgi:hypothetical protein
MCLQLLSTLKLEIAHEKGVDIGWCLEVDYHCEKRQSAHPDD